MLDPAHRHVTDHHIPAIWYGSPDEEPTHDPGPKTGTRKEQAPVPPKPETETSAEG